MTYITIDTTTNNNKVINCANIDEAIEMMNTYKKTDKARTVITIYDNGMFFIQKVI